MQESNDESALDSEHSNTGGHTPEPQLIINECKEQPLSSDGETVTKLSAAYCRVMILCLAIGLTFSGFFAISSLLTSFNQELGYFTAILLWIPYVPAQLFISPTVGKILNPKTSVVAAFSCYTFFYATNIYPSWYTLPIGAIVYTMGSGLFFWAGSLTYLTQLAHAVSKGTGTPASHYIGNFQGLFFLFFALSGVIGNGLSLVFLLPDQLLIDSANAASRNLSSNISVLNNTPEQCDRDVRIAAVSPWAYYGLTSALVVLGLVSVILVIFIPPRPKICKNRKHREMNCSTLQCHVDKKHMCHGMRKLVINPLKLLLKPTFIAVGGLSLFSGYEYTFFSGTFTKVFLVMFISLKLGMSRIQSLLVLHIQYHTVSHVTCTKNV